MRKIIPSLAVLYASLSFTPVLYGDVQIEFAEAAKGTVVIPHVIKGGTQTGEVLPALAAKKKTAKAERRGGPVKLYEPASELEELSYNYRTPDGVKEFYLEKKGADGTKYTRIIAGNEDITIFDRDFNLSAPPK